MTLQKFHIVKIANSPCVADNTENNILNVFNNMHNKRLLTQFIYQMKCMYLSHWTPFYSFV